MGAVSERPVFYYDLNSPYAWLAAERINKVLPEPPVWQPIAFAFILRHDERTPWSLKSENSRVEGVAEIERRAAERGLPAPRWPEGWPRETYNINAMRAATYAAEIGKVVSFSLAAYRQQFNAGRGLNDFDNVLLAGAAAEIHPNALLQAVERQAIKDRLKAATEEAIELGVPGVPTVRVGDELFWGDDRLEEAAEAVRAAAA
jgi:2-hydroxychromene-2-carboxylate isomerase